MPRTINAAITRIVQETPDVKTFRLEFSPEHSFDFFPGQFANLVFEKNIDGKIKKIVRSYSVSSSPTKKGYIEITVKRTSAGGVADFLHTLNVGDTADFAAPFGVFYFKEGMSRNIVLICGGSGIAPFMSIIRYITETKLDAKVVIVYSSKTKQDIIFYNELNELLKINKNLKIVFTLTRTMQGDWKGRTGRITKEMIEENVDSIGSALFYVCGPKEFIISTVNILNTIGIEQQNIKLERWS